MRGKPFEKGDPRAGRPKGTPNKVTVDIREAIRAIVESVYGDGVNGKAMKWLEQVGKEDPARALSITVQLAEFTVPKLQRSEITTDLKNTLPLPTIVIRPAAPAEPLRALEP